MVIPAFMAIALLQTNVPAFGSHYAGKPYLFHVLITRGGHSQKVADVEAAYGTCDVYVVDLDADAEPEIVVESGVG